MTFRRPIAVLAVVVLGLTVAAACTIASGPSTTEPRAVADVDNLRVESGIAVTLTLGTPPAATVTAPADVQELVVLETVADTLHIHLREPVTTTSRIEVALTMATVTGIEASGGAVVEVEGLLEVAGLAVETSGGARVTATGTVGELTAVASGGSRQELAELVATTVTVDASGGSVVLLQATGEVTGAASGGARVNVQGDASVRVETSGGANLETE